ncbi:MATE family efflux transporter [Carboxydothermus hydrogenoformans]|uniref:Probable multidrug resistance protein NorM n=1 Tax=Carboxydothermus hydrogenoformans (strain ATCC BAA-161 / DSM 6008 / Z-2901) TaxID=246194 RepID=Q3ABR4_CARHZ|nr:MATE family efflux transporter [Carboxydothermus hydrogenoformans]ABB16112.1 MATE efflux family protein [Carboxydothermus hydrogenoformans Z-2901]
MYFEIIKVALPAVLEMILHMVVGIVDTAMVGRLGATAVAGVSLGAQIIFSTFFVFAAIGTGGGALAAQALGAKKKEEVKKFFSYSLLLAFFAGFLLFFLPYIVEIILPALKIDKNVALVTISYLKTIGKFAVFALLVFVGNGLLRAIGQTRVPLYTAVVINCLNIFLDYVLIFGKLGFPKLGPGGAALASGISLTLGSIIALGYIGLIEKKLSLKFQWLEIRVYLKKIIQISIPAALEEGSFSLGRVVVSFILVKLGAVSFAANEIAIYIESLAYMPGYGLAIAAYSFAARFYGEGNYQKAKSYIEKTLNLTILGMGLMGIIFFFLPQQLGLLFTKDVDVLEKIKVCLKIGAFEQIPTGIEMVLGSVYRGVGNTKIPFYLTTAGMWLFRLPLFWYLFVLNKYDVSYAWMVSVLQWSILMSIYLYLFQKGHWWSVTELQRDQG